MTPYLLGFAMRNSLAAAALSFVALFSLSPAARGQQWPADIRPLTWEGDLASRMVDGCDRFLLNQIEQAEDLRAKHWQRDFSSAEAYAKSIEPNRARLAQLLGMADDRPAAIAMEVVHQVTESPVLARSDGFEIIRVRWKAFGNVEGEGLLALPGGPAMANVIAIPDADVTPEALFGLIKDLPPASQYALRLAEQGCRVLVPTLVDRTMSKRRGRANLTNREYLYRPAFVLGRHLIGYELQKVLAAVDWMEQQSHGGQKAPCGIIGWGEGGMLALYAGAVDPRIDAVCVSGYFERRDQIWREPISRNVFARLHEFGDAELAAMIHPRTLVVEACRGPELTLPGEGGAPAVLRTPPLDRVEGEWRRFRELVMPLEADARHELVISGDDGRGDYATPAALKPFLQALGIELAADLQPQRLTLFNSAADHQQFASERMQRQIAQLVDHNRLVLHHSAQQRRVFMQQLDTSSLESFRQSQIPYREHFAKEVIGSFDLPRLPARPRIRRAYDHSRWTGYEVVLDVFPDVFAYGILLVPNDLQAGEKRPVVVCQHGLEGRPQDVVAGDHRAYHDFAAKLAERGFITFAPQNIYIFEDRFRTLQRKAYPLKKTLFSIMVPQHQQITDWLQTLPFVDPDRIAFYGLSYGGKSAMRIPPLVSDYCLSICSADFNEWVWKNASTEAPHSYVWTGEYEIFEFNLGGTFNYAEMAALIAPRPFMVERGHFDGVAPDETVAYEFAKVRNLYAARLKLPDRCEIEWFAGPHTINGKGTFEFLHRHLKWQRPQNSE